MDTIYSRLETLGKNLDGDLRYDNITLTVYSTDASVYKETPVAIVWPKNTSDIKKILQFAISEKISLTMRAGGTSLAGQVVTSGIIVDVSKYMNNILEINQQERWIRVQPGVVLDELNLFLKKFNLFFGPETSTSSRCNIGGMVGNNACGSHSIIYGSTREHILELKTILSDGSEAIFNSITKDVFATKLKLNNLEGEIYRTTYSILSENANRKSIQEEYPDPKIPRRNTGYALDMLLHNEMFDETSKDGFNFCKLLAGSEGTLAITTEIKLNLVPLPPSHKALVCIHLRERNDAFRANLIAIRYNPSAVEMMDDRILKLTENNLSQRNNRFFLEGDPGAILIVEFALESDDEINKITSELISEMKSTGFGYAFPVIKGRDISKVWNLRKAGLGVLTNMKGDAKPVSLIEDTAVNVEQMPEYMADIETMLAGYGKDAVFHAHIGTGELHIRPVLNLKEKNDVELFRAIGIDTANIVKKYKGSMSGEHGDGRLRGEFIPTILGEHNYQLHKRIKECWDPDKILNPGKITDTPKMNTSLRYIPGQTTRTIETIFDFSSSDGIVRAVEKCNGSADCRKSSYIGGTMCPSFMATGDENFSTRARANVIREYLNKGVNPWDHIEIYNVLEMCLACKGCKSECPSGVDIAKIKSEFLQHWYDKHGIPLRTIFVAYITVFNRLGALLPSFYNFILKNQYTSGAIKGIIGFAKKRSIPLLYKTTLRKWLRKNLVSINPKNPQSSVCLFIDEFTNYNDTDTGIAVVKLLVALNYKIIVVDHPVSARTFISKGLIKKARKIIRKNISIFGKIINEDLPLVGIEPSSILGFRDEFPELAGDDMKNVAEKIGKHSYLIDEFITSEFNKGKIDRKLFTDSKLQILLHAHCQQKAIASSLSSLALLSIPENYSVTEIPSGCCGMAGSFGYEKEHFDFSNKIGELVLFPEIRNSNEDTVIAAPGTSCRHHIKDGTGRIAKHPALILYEALRKGQ
jgi:FAD/FMN-containing dehydrogenase/Fe-S oxidoreductase